VNPLIYGRASSAFLKRCIDVNELVRSLNIKITGRYKILAFIEITPSKTNLPKLEAVSEP
jgi:hypothetical protein